jgi:hypothetical protein
MSVETAAVYRYTVVFRGFVEAFTEDEAIDRAMDQVAAGDATDCDVDVELEDE